jgi:predicted alternative tryptophan synthase beta-subunit
MVEGEQKILPENRINLDEDELPTRYYNIQAYLSEDQAIQCKKTGEEKVLAFNNCGHGLLDIKAYEDFLAGKLTDYEPLNIEVETYLK